MRIDGYIDVTKGEIIAMGDFLSQLEDKAISFEYFGKNDIATGIELKDIVDNKEFYFKLIDEYPLTGINDLQDYCIYLIYDKFSKYEEMIPLLAKEEYKECIRKLTDTVRIIVESVKTADVIKFINGNISDIFESDLKIIGIKHVTLDLIAKYKGGISEDTYRWLCKDYDYLLLDRFEEFESIFEKYTDLFDGIFKTGKYQEIDSLREETIFNIFTSIYRKTNSPLKITVNRVVTVLSNDILELCENATLENVMFVERTLRRFYSCLVKMESPIANSFVSVKKRVEALLNESLKKNGQVFKYEIPTGQIIDEWKKQREWEVRMITLTHEKVVDDKGKLRLRSRMEIEDNAEKSIMDMVSTNIPKDDYYTFELQQRLSIIESIEVGTLISLMRNYDTYCELMNMLMSVTRFISEKLECSEEQLDFDLKILDSHLQMCMSAEEKAKETAKETDIALCYGASMFLCALIDKLLRILYVHIAGVNQYIAVDKVTLGNTLNPNNKLMRDFFGEKHIRHLAFILSKDGIKERTIGYNRRNSLAHWTINPNTVTTSLVAELVWMFIDVMNTIFIHFL